jgi:hypothetical protein
MSRHRTIISLAPIHEDIEVQDEIWLWYQSEITTESMPKFINRFLVQSLSEKANEEDK